MACWVSVYASDPDDRNKPYLLALEKMIYAKGSNTGDGNQVTADGHQRDGALTHTIGPVVDKARSGSFWETYNQLVAGEDNLSTLLRADLPRPFCRALTRCTRTKRRRS